MYSQLFLLFFYRLRKSNLNVKFVTNTTKESQRLLFERLQKIGFDIESHEIFSSLSAAVKLIKKKSLRPLLLVDERAQEDFHGKHNIVHGDIKDMVTSKLIWWHIHDMIICIHVPVVHGFNTYYPTYVYTRYYMCNLYKFHHLLT